MKKITIIIDTEEENTKIEYFVNKWIEDNFTEYKKAKIEVEDVEEDKKLVG